VVVAPTFLHIPMVQSALSNKQISISAQNVAKTKSGAYTGEHSAELLKDFGLDYTLVGHSERRHGNAVKESDEEMAMKVEQATNNGLHVLMCIGETLEEREANQTDQVCEKQLRAIASSVKDWKLVSIAYEPVWAIGTGKVASPQQAQDAHKAIRAILKEYKAENTCIM